MYSDPLPLKSDTVAFESIISELSNPVTLSLKITKIGMDEILVGEVEEELISGIGARF